MSNVTAHMAPDAYRKRLATATAIGALDAITIFEIEGDFGPQIIATKWALTRSFTDLDELENWLATVTGKKV